MSHDMMFVLLIEITTFMTSDFSFMACNVYHLLYCFNLVLSLLYFEIVVYLFGQVINHDLQNPL
jgi:hypothetical protein